MGGDVLINGWLSWWCYGGAGDAMPSETGHIKQHTRRRGIFTQQLLLRFSSTPNNSTNQPNHSSLNLYPMALPRGLINSCKFVAYNRDEVTQAE